MESPKLFRWAKAHPKELHILYRAFVLKRRTFSVISLSLLALFFVWQILDWIEFLIRDPSTAIVHNNWMRIVAFGVYFSVAYSLVFIKAWGKIPPAESTWPPSRCYGLLLWTLITVLPAFPLCGPAAVRAHVTICIAVDILFLIRMIIGRMRNEAGWIWQTYAVAYIWMEFLLPDVPFFFRS
jgi:hypothetical protein